MPLSAKNLILLMLMLVSAGLAMALRPHINLADQRPKVDLETLVPKQFGDWRELQQSSGQIVNPQATELLQKLYSQTLSRTYIDAAGSIIMLSIAYGASQSDGVALHYPEVCYPAQGFQLLTTAKAEVPTDFGNISAKQIMTRLGNRYEPVTYWSTLGDKVVQSGMNTKLAQLDYGFKGIVPDGLIFGVSSIDRDASKGYEVQAKFARQFVAALPPESRLRLAGLGS